MHTERLQPQHGNRGTTNGTERRVIEKFCKTRLAFSLAQHPSHLFSFSRRQRWHGKNLRDRFRILVNSQFTDQPVVEIDIPGRNEGDHQTGIRGRSQCRAIASVAVRLPAELRRPWFGQHQRSKIARRAQTACCRHPPQNLAAMLSFQAKSTQAFVMTTLRPDQTKDVHILFANERRWLGQRPVKIPPCLCALRITPPENRNTECRRLRIPVQQVKQLATPARDADCRLANSMGDTAQLLGPREGTRAIDFHFGSTFNNLGGHESHYAVEAASARLRWKTALNRGSCPP